ncbi:DUF4466 family protein [Chitinophaga filiformis]|uniref:DUF4466 family protein n=1 Tax=Chitinophaga filiformis TaxID=104663 RepID=A0ABY4HVS7_CHIFI|nr:DUF4466 family protein [Chitinophaga filiformis]UPK66656.1 DUF4466 family protein [Chitinophaga filiformis]
MNIKYVGYTLWFFSICVLVAGCKDDKYAVPSPKNELQNDCIKRTLGPNVAGLKIEFAYAIALPAAKGKIVSAQVEASIAGDAATYLENKSYYTNGSGEDVGIPIGDPSVNEGPLTKVAFTKDTNAVTLRYYYVIPRAAQGKEVKFTFSARSSNGETVSYTMGPYTISKMDMVLDLPVKNGDACFISIADMAVYNATDAAANAGKIDLVYLYRAISGISFNHALVAPAADTAYLPGVVLPTGVNRDTKIRKTWNLRDFHLARLQYGVYIDDLDFQQLDMKDAPDYAINLKTEAGAWIETADGKYRAYIFMNKADDGKKSATISIKRYTLK